MKKYLALNQQLTLRSVFSSVLTLCFISFANGQTSASMHTNTAAKIKSEQWQSLCGDGSIEISYKYVKCDLASEGTSQENVYLQIQNKTDREVKLEWNTEYWYNGKCNGCESGNAENIKTIVLKPNESKEGYCAEGSDPSLKILSKMLNMNDNTELTNFNVSNVRSTTITQPTTK